MNRDFYYFNPRLTDKLNMIVRRPLTIISAHKSTGKNTAIKAYLTKQKGDVIWQAIAGDSFQSWLIDFCSYIKGQNTDASGCDDRLEKQIIQSSEDPVSSVSFFLKKTGLKAPTFYVVEMGEVLNREVLGFLHQLAKQGINGLFLIIITEDPTFSSSEYGMDSRINLITTSDFLMRVTDIQHGYTEYGIPLTLEEALLIFQLSNGWAPLVSMLFQRIKKCGKDAIWRYLCNFPDHREIGVKCPQEMGYKQFLQNFLARMSLVDAFSLAEAEQIDRYSGGLLSVEMPVREILNVNQMPALFYYNDTDGLFHVHWILRDHFSRMFSEIPMDEQKQMRSAYEKLYVQDDVISEELKIIQNLIIEMNEKEVQERIQRLMLMQQNISPRYRYALLILDNINGALMGRAQKSIATLNKAMIRCFETGAFNDGKLLMMGSLLLKYFLGGAYLEGLEELEKHILYENFFNMDDLWDITFWLRCIILIRRKRNSEIEALLEATPATAKFSDSKRCFFKELARIKIESNSQELQAAIENIARMNYRLPLVVAYDKIFPHLDNLNWEDKTFIDSIKSSVNSYRRHMRINHGQNSDAFGAQLTRRQVEAAMLAANGFSNKEIAQQMGVSENTIKTTLRLVFQKLGIKSRKELMEKGKNLLHLSPHTYVTLENDN